METNTNTIDLSVVVPAYNEERRLPAMLADARTHLSRSGLRFELLVVDDGSTDRTLDVCRAFAAFLPELQVIATNPNRGKGHAVRVGMLAARGALVLMADADGSTPMRELDGLLAARTDANAAIAIGSRYLGGGTAHGQPLWRRAWSRLANVIVRRKLLPGICDAHCGFKLFTLAAARELFSRATVDGWTFDLEVLALAQRRGHRIVEVPVTWRDDARSRVRAGRDLWRVVRETIALDRRLRAADASRPIP